MSKGVVYLLHFDEKLKHAQHYIGFTKVDVLTRLVEHKENRGSRLTQALNKNKIDYRVVRIWRGCGRKFERKLKNRKQASIFCPICNPKTKRSATIINYTKDINENTNNI